MNLAAELLPLIIGNVGALVVLSIACVVLYRELGKEQKRTARVDGQAESMLSMLQKILALIEGREREEAIRREYERRLGRGRKDT